MHWGEILTPYLLEGNSSATPMLYPSLIIMSPTLELGTRSHRHHNPFEDEVCIYRPDQKTAVCFEL